jgi:hypothetical protein
MFPDWWFHIGFALLGIAEIILIVGLWLGWRKHVRDCTPTSGTKDHGERWPHEPCGRSLAQCPYNKAEHIEYFQSRGDKPSLSPFR